MRTADPSPRQERLLSEISHEVGNYFHKLYYWAELLREQRPGADAEPAELLERTIRDLEAFLKTALEYFRPMSVAPSTMTVDELTASVRALVGRHAEPATVQWRIEPAAPGVVAVDPGRFSFVLQGLVRRLDPAPGGEFTAAIAVEPGPDEMRYVLTLTGRGTERGTASGVAGAIEWAVIERIVELHGGAVAADVAGTDRTVRLTVPVRS
ncbi:MAG TPA: hypothetical protein VNO26_02440 [Candidatus Limnocylindria bacterium]|nr:hypothetical protein [Candidatus Limnocylindria bacterium]